MSMTVSDAFTLLVIDKSGEVQEKQIQIKGVDRLYSVCNYRNEDGFEELHSWRQSSYTLRLYGKRKGKTNYENKGVFPQPIHQELFYGNLCLMKKCGEDPQSITVEEWNQFIESKETKVECKELKKEEYEE